MKKFYTILILTLVLSLSASAQNPFKTKKTAKQQVETRNAGLRNLFPIGNSLPDSAYISNREGQIHEKLMYSFDNEGRLIETSYRKRSGENGELLNIWDLSSQSSYRIDSLGRIVEETYSYYNPEEQKWIASYMEKNTYHKGDKMTMDEYYEFNQNTGQWYVVEKSVYRFDNQDNMIGYTDYELEDVNGDGNMELIVTQEVKCDYTIDAEGYLNYLIYFKDMQEAGADFELGLKMKQKYNDQHYLIYSEEAERIYDQWDDNSKSETVYENGKLISEEEFYLGDDGITWNLNEKTEYTYNSKGQLVKEVMYSSDDETNEVYINSTKELFYTDSQSSIETGKADSDVKLSIVNGILSIDTNQAETVTVYSITGSQIATFDKSEGQASTSILHEGVVIVKGSSGWATKAISK